MALALTARMYRGGIEMKHTMIGVLGTTMLVALGWPAWGQPANSPTELPRLTLRQAVQTALDKHPALQSAEFAVRGAESRFNQAKAPYYPQVGGSAIQTNGALRSNAFLRPSGSLIQPNQSDVTV